MPRTEVPTLRKPVILLGLATVMIAAFVILRQQQIDLEAVRGHVDALAAWRTPNDAAVVTDFFAAYGNAGRTEDDPMTAEERA